MLDVYGRGVFDCGGLCAVLEHEYGGFEEVGARARHGGFRRARSALGMLEVRCSLASEAVVVWCS